jgi:CRISPR/Cas system-associated protein Cas10 (large subunit of type III CRISPR-Cas system)
MSRIPDEFKVEENVFRMKDKTGNTYLLEWKDGKAEIIGHTNKQGMNESIERMKSLFNYKASDYYKGTTTNSRLNEESQAFTDTLDKARKIIK